VTLLEVALAVITVGGAVVSTAHVWVPVLCAGVALAAGVRLTPRERRHRTRHPDTSGHDADTPPDIAAQVFSLRPDLHGHRPDMPAGACPDVSG
jgi:hypothetical protein